MSTTMMAMVSVEASNISKRPASLALLMVPGAEAKDLRSLLKVGGNSHGAGDHVEQDVPLRAQEHEQHGRELHAAR